MIVMLQKIIKSNSSNKLRRLLSSIGMQCVNFRKNVLRRVKLLSIFRTGFYGYNINHKKLEGAPLNVRCSSNFCIINNLKVFSMDLKPKKKIIQNLPFIFF